MKLREHPAVKDHWATLIWNGGSYGSGDKFSTEPAGTELGILKAVDLVPLPGNKIRLVREHLKQERTAFLDPDEPAKTRLYILLKKAIGTPIADIGDFRVDENLNRI